MMTHKDLPDLGQEQMESFHNCWQRSLDHRQKQDSDLWYCMELPRYTMDRMQPLVARVFRNCYNS
jgi:hypothetical protein